MRLFIGSLITLCVICPFTVSANVKDYQVKQGTTAVPKSLKADIQKLFTNKTIQFCDKQGKVIAEIWFRQHIPVKAKKAKVSYRDIKQTAILAAIQFKKPWQDYRKQKIKPGVYTLRFGFQPQDGDHMGTSPHPEFCILLADKFDPKVGALNPKEMAERSAASVNTTHPGVFLLFPNMDKSAKVGLSSRPGDHVVLTLRQPIAVNQKASTSTLGIALTLVGHANE